MEERHVFTTLWPYMLDIIQPQAYDLQLVYMDSVLNPSIITLTANTIHYINCLLKGLGGKA